MDAIFVLYVLGICFTGIAMITTLLAFFMETGWVSIANWIVTLLAAICLFIASIMVTVVGSKVVDELNDKGNDIGVYADRGSKFLGLTWAPTVLMIAASVTWFTMCCTRLRKQKKEFNEKHAERAQQYEAEYAARNPEPTNTTQITGGEREGSSDRMI